jgi:hypothetical protein
VSNGQRRFQTTIALSCVAMAQNFNGVSIGGTLDVPTLVNQSNPKRGVMAYVVQRFDTNNINRVSTVPDVPSLVRGQGISNGMLGIWTRFTKGYVNPVTGRQIMEGDVTAWVLKAVLFSDGTYYGDPNEFARLKQMFANFRSFARALAEAGPTKWDAMIQQAIGGPFDLADRNLMKDRVGLAENLKELGSGMGAGIARVAELPDVVRG